MKQAQVAAARRALQPHPPLKRDIGTAVYTFLVYHSDRSDSVFLTFFCDRELLRTLTYHYHHRLTGITHILRFHNPGNGMERDPHFVFLPIRDLMTSTNRTNPSPSDGDVYYDSLKDFISYRILELVRLAGSKLTTHPTVYHFSIELEVIEEFLLSFLRNTVPPDARAGNIELTWQ